MSSAGNKGQPAPSTGKQATHVKFWETKATNAKHGKQGNSQHQVPSTGKQGTSTKCWKTGNLLKCHYDGNRIFSIEAILKPKQVACMRRKVLFTIFKYLFLFQRCSSFLKYANWPSDDIIHLFKFVSEMFDSLQKDSTKCAPQFQLNSFATMATCSLLGSRPPQY